MKVSIIYSGHEPRILVGNLEGILMRLWGRTEHIVSKDPTDDTIASWFDFYLELIKGNWIFSYRSNRVFSDEKEKAVLDTLIAKSNEAITQKKPVDLSNDFNKLNRFEPFTFGGLFARMDERNNPILENGDRAQALENMRNDLRSYLLLNEAESDEHLYNFAHKIPRKIIWVNHTEVDKG